MNKYEELRDAIYSNTETESQETAIVNALQKYETWRTKKTVRQLKKLLTEFKATLIVDVAFDDKLVSPNYAVTLLEDMCSEAIKIVKGEYNGQTD